jgi:hypothetical protein
MELCVLSALLLGSCTGESGARHGNAAANPGRDAAAEAGHEAAAKPGRDAAAESREADAGRVRAVVPHETLLLAGLCDYPFAFPLSSCEGIDAMTDCAIEKCGLASCDSTCTALLDCADATRDACSPECMRTTECNDCLADVVTRIPVCLDRLVCSTTSTGGPCDRMRACCAVASDDETKTLCLSSIDLIAKLSGDQGCTDGAKDQTFVDGYPRVSKCVDDALSRDP